MNEAVFISALIGIGIALLFIRLAALERRLNRLSRVDAKIDALLKNAAVEFDEFENVPTDVREALEHGETILAIRRLRAATGMGLKEAKEFVDEVRRRRVVSG
jgi:ribosomal protein L7/L12